MTTTLPDRQTAEALLRDAGWHPFHTDVRDYPEPTIHYWRRHGRVGMLMTNARTGKLEAVEHLHFTVSWTTECICRKDAMFHSGNCPILCRSSSLINSGVPHGKITFTGVLGVD